MAKHTPEPWTVGVSLGADGWPVFRLRDLRDPNPDGDEVQADARLMRAAPALLAACEAALLLWGRGESIHPEQAEVDAICAAVAKALGELS